MTCRSRCLFVLFAALSSLGASYRTPHFLVEAPNEKVAKQVGDKAEAYRESIARKWLGRELPDQRDLHAIRVIPAKESGSSATSFAFEEGRILSVEMRLEGPIEYLLSNHLPHEITHIIFAYRFRKPVCRWAEEGAAILSEPVEEWNRHEKWLRKILETPDRFIPLRQLFSRNDYPRDVIALFAEGYAISRFLIESRDRKTFLAFVSNGMDGEWDDACKTHYGYDTVEEMESAWLKWLSAKKLCREQDVAKVHTSLLERQRKCLQLENQLLKLQLAQARRTLAWQTDRSRLEAEVKRLQEALEKLRRAEHPSPPGLSVPPSILDAPLKKP